jgi:hypothetical protein
VTDFNARFRHLEKFLLYSSVVVNNLALGAIFLTRLALLSVELAKTITSSFAHNTDLTVFSMLFSAFPQMM